MNQGEVCANIVVTGMVCNGRGIYHRQCLLSDVNKGFARVTRGKVNRGA